MKIIALLVIVISMIWTWKIVYSPPTIEKSVEQSVAEEMEHLITLSIKKMNPLIKEVDFQQLDTERVEEDLIKLSFSYSFLQELEDGEVTEEKVIGDTYLERISAPEEFPSLWKLSEVRTSNNTIVFSEGTVITASVGLPSPVQNKTQIEEKEQIVIKPVESVNESDTEQVIDVDEHVEMQESPLISDE